MWGFEDGGGRGKAVWWCSSAGEGFDDEGSGERRGALC